MNRDNSIGIATGYELDGRGSISGRDKIFSVLHSVQTGSGAQPASYAIGIGGFRHQYSYRVVKLTIQLYLVQRSRMVELYLRSPLFLKIVMFNLLRPGKIVTLYDINFLTDVCHYYYCHVLVTSRGVLISNWIL
jgi:hypothetical protein